jgi:hypothetical protein
VSADRFLRGFAKARRDQTVTVLAHGPYTVLLKCQGSFSGAGWRESAQLLFKATEEARSSRPVPEPATGGASLPAGTEVSVGATPPASSTETSFAAVGGYLDISRGRSLDVSARLRVNHLGVEGCSAIVNATLGGF